MSTGLWLFALAVVVIWALAERGVRASVASDRNYLREHRDEWRRSWYADDKFAKQELDAMRESYGTLSDDFAVMKRRAKRAEKQCRAYEYALRKIDPTFGTAEGAP